jgi:hypothetical protein
MSEAALREMLDKMAIAELTASYNRALDDLDAGGVSATFCEEGVLDLGFGRPREGRAAIEELVGLLGFGTVHATTDSLIEIDGEHATQVCTLMLFKRREDRSACEFWLTGRYRDELRRVDGGWRFSHRSALLDLFAPPDKGSGAP